jgi:hypothetical protein
MSSYCPESAIQRGGLEYEIGQDPYLLIFEYNNTTTNNNIIIIIIKETTYRDVSAIV